jgi:hypothetical protein
MSWPCLGLRLLLLALGTAGEPQPHTPAGVAVQPDSLSGTAVDEKKPVPVYTNDDLDRISPFRDETGVSSAVAVPQRATVSGREADDGRARSETYWRREAERVRVRVQRARERVEDLRARIAASEAQSGPRSGEARSRGRAQAEAWRRQIGAMEARIRESEAELADRARRAGALPGWLR